MKPGDGGEHEQRSAHHVAPLIGAKKLSDVTAGRHRADRRGQSPPARPPSRAKKARSAATAGGDSAAAKAVRVVSAMFAFAMRRGLMAANPCTLAKVRRSDNKRDRYLGLDEIAMLGKAIAVWKARARSTAKAGNIVRLLLLTGCRRNEINQLRWDEVDLKGMRLVLAETKTGKSVRPLAAPAAGAAGLPGARQEGSPWVFPGKRPDGPYDRPPAGLGGRPEGGWA